MGRVVAEGIDLNGDARVFGIGVSGPIVTFLAGVIWGNLRSAVTFASGLGGHPAAASRRHA